MPKLWLALIGMAAVAAAVALVTPRAEAMVSAAPLNIASETSAIERAACARRRVCGPRGCVWRTVCRRW